MSNNNGKAAKAGLSYIVGNYCIKGIGIISAPLFARLLTTEDYGIYNTFTAYEGILYIIICLALHASLKNAYIRYENKIDEYASSVSIIPIIMWATCTIAVILFNEFFTRLTGLSYAMLIIVVFYSYCSGVIIFYRYRIALEYRSKEYLFMSFFNVLCNFVISLLLIFTIFNGKRYLGRVVGGVIPYTVLTIYILYHLRKKARFKYNKEYWFYGLKVSLPLIPHGLAQIFLLQFDRIMINSMCSSVSAGIYSFSYTLYSLVQIAGSSLNTAFEPWGFQHLKNKEVGSIQRIGTCFLLLLAGIVTVCILFAPEIVLLVGGKKYEDSIYTTIPILLAGFFAMAYSIPALVEFYNEKTHYISIGTSIAAVTNVLLNIVFIKKYGYVAAAYTTLFCYILYFAVHTYISRKLSGFFIMNIKTLVITLLILVTALIVGLRFVDALFIRATVCFLLVFVGLVLLIQCYGLKNIKAFLEKRGE